MTIRKKPPVSTGLSLADQRAAGRKGKRSWMLLALALLAATLTFGSRPWLEIDPPQPLPAYEADWQPAPEDLPRDKQMRLSLKGYLHPAGTMTLDARWYNAGFRQGSFDGNFSLQKWDGQGWHQTSLPFDYQPPIQLMGWGVLPFTCRQCCYGLAGQIPETTPGRYRLVCRDKSRNCQAEAEFAIYPMDWDKFRGRFLEQRQKKARKQASRLTWPTEEPGNAPSVWQYKLQSAKVDRQEGEEP